MKGYRWVVLGVIILASFVAYILRTNVSIVGESMMLDLGMNEYQLGLVFSAFAAGYAIFQFPGGMIGALLAGLAYRMVRKSWAAAVGEIIGTGGIAPVVSAFFVAPVLMGNAIPLLALVPSFLFSTAAGALLGILALRLLKRANIVDF